MTDRESVPGVAVPVRPARLASTQASVLLDGVRGVAALLVLLEHWRNYFFLDYTQLTGHRWLYAGLYLLVSPGHQAVSIFFVLSGYLIAGSVLRMFERGRWSWRDYLTHRCVRLWVVLVPCLVIAALCDGIGLHLHRAPAVTLYQGLAGNHEMVDVRSHFSLPIWLGNVFFLGTVKVPFFGSDGALWSLANEFWYYILFPLGLIALRRGTRPALRMMNLLLFAAVLLFLPWGKTVLFPVWLAGAYLATIKPPRLSHKVRVLAVAIYTPIILLFAKQTRLSDLQSTYLFTVFTVTFLWVMLSAVQPADERTVTTRVTRLLARFSFTLYVVHQPVLTLVAAVCLGFLRWYPTPRNVLYGLCILAATLLFCWALAAITEFRTDAVRRRVERLWGSRQAPAQA